MKFLSKFFGTANERMLKNYYADLKKINELESKYALLSDDDLSNQTFILRERIKNGETLLDVKCDAFAVVRESSKRILKMRHFDVQILGGLVLHDGKIAQMKTGEGKTLVATLPTYLNALSFEPVHVITANDYLVRRDAEQLEKLYAFLGLRCGFVISSTPLDLRKAEYEKDIIYVTNNELGFDYLRDNMKTSFDEMSLISRPLSYAIVDEIDSILIDEARTPLIISGSVETNNNLYGKINQIINILTPDCYEVEEKYKNIFITEKGYEVLENHLRNFGLIGEKDSVFGSSYQSGAFERQLSPEEYVRNTHIIHKINQALKANVLFKKDIDYLVKNGEIVIIDDFTGRISEGRRFSDGLHQAIEVKHGLEIKPESQTLASITYQNYFRLYKKLSGMTGTAQTEAEEFREIYSLLVVCIPTNKPMCRVDLDDAIYRTEAEKFDAIAREVLESKKIGQPVLIGTDSVKRSERLSMVFKKYNIEHSVLNAKYHDQEAEIIADAGRFGAVTISTNMAGRGTDIILGGNKEKRIAKATRYILNQDEKEKIIAKIEAEWLEESNKVKNAGGLYVICSVRHESRRVDNQLNGRSGRQGDVGKSKFFLSLEDDLLRIFGADKLDNILSKLGMKEGEAMTHPWLNSVITKAQKRVETHNFDIRKNLLKYDNITNEQRLIVYSRRFDLLKNDDTFIESFLKDLILEEVLLCFESCKKLEPEESLEKKRSVISNIFLLSSESFETEVFENIDVMYKKLVDFLFETHLNIDRCRMILTTSLDIFWREHLHSLDVLRTNSSFKSYANKDPFNEYKIQGYAHFIEMLEIYRSTVLSEIFALKMASQI